jgi:serpin B
MGLSGCAQRQAEPAGVPEAQLPSASEVSAEPADIVQGSTDMGIDLYRRVGAGGGNVFLSPVSISTALGMVYAGAEGETAAEMKQALRYPSGIVHGGMGALLGQLPIDADGRVVRIANALWVQKNFALREAYSLLVKRDYGSEASQVDFVGAPDQAIAWINGWAEEKTQGRIKGLLVRDNINELTRLILTNSIYFKADWLKPFSASQTGKRPFLLPGGRSAPATFMRQRGAFRMLAQPGFQALEAPYKGEELSMILFVPETPEGLAGFESALTGEKLKGWIEALMAQQPGDVEFVMPKLQLATKASLVPQLKAMGMPRAFTKAAQFGGIASPAELHLSDVIHQTFLLVDEKGTEAAAVTAALMEIESMPRPFHADRPFFFVIRDNRSGANLFMGRISDPARMLAGR